MTVATAQAAAEGRPSQRWLARAQPPAAHPCLILNPKSGGGKVGKFSLKRKAERLGALRVRVPRDRPGVTPPKPPLNWGRLWYLTAPLKRQLRRSNSPSRGA